jgi:hypothetical protein
VKPRGRMDSVSAAVGEAAASLRRRREGRRPYAKVYDDQGVARVLDPASAQAAELIAAAEAMVDAVDAGSRAGRGP